MFSNVVVGVGGHESWHDAIALATKLVGAAGRLTLANVYVFGAEPRLSAGYSREVEAMERERAAELLQMARARAGMPAAARWRGATSVRQGLHEIAERLEADLLVVGISRPGPLGRALSGGNTQAVINRAPCAVAAAPAGYAQHAGRIRRVAICHGHSSGRLANDSGAADLLVVGSCGSRLMGQVLRRSTPRKLTAAAKRPVVVLPRGVDRLAAVEALVRDWDERPFATEFS